MKRQSLLIFGWLLLAMPVAVQAQFNYTVTKGTVTITRYTGSGGVVVIPDTIDGLPVASLGINAFAGYTLTSVTIPNSVTSIGIYAFGGCTSLTNVTIPDSVTSIGDYVFLGCTSLPIVTIGNNVTRLGDRAFLYCTALTAISVETGAHSLTMRNLTRLGPRSIALLISSAHGRSEGTATSPALTTSASI